ncbi:ankyrin, partial [Cadophora sp. DSE1049]
MAEPANFATLPTEVLLLINSNLSDTGDINAICQLTRRLYHLFLPEVFDRHLAWARTTNRPKKERDSLIAIFLHAAKYNSSNLIQQLFCYREIVDFKGTPFSHHSITYLHFAVSMDAPVIASHLMKHGSSSEFSIDSLSTTYPDLTPLYMALARPYLITQHELNAALRIACSYALPRTTSFILARGADARAVSIYGISVLHATLTCRARWRFFDEFYAYMEPSVPPATLWEEFIWATTKSLVSYGADPRLKIENSRMHSCNTKCWQSVNCEHSQQTPAHLAAASGFASVLRFLVKRVGLNVLEEKNGGGYTPLYGALVQGHDVAATYILRQQPHIPNPIVRTEDNSTALHIASRFALEQVVTYILEHGATNDINREDSKGRTPLHEVLSQENLEREYEVVGTLHILAKAGADPD